MAQNDRRPVRVTIVIDMEVTSADRHGLHFDQDLIVLDLWFRDLSDLNQAFSLAIFYDCFHRISLGGSTPIGLDCFKDKTFLSTPAKKWRSYLSLTTGRISPPR
jgi:hypothetical protein